MFNKRYVGLVVRKTVTCQLYVGESNKKAQLSLTNPRDAKAYQKYIGPIRQAYNVVADNTGLYSFV